MSHGPNAFRRIPLARWGVQGAYLLFCLLVGIEFWRFHAQILAGGAVTASRPGAVEAFLPISALMGLKRFILTGRYDAIHPAGLTIFIAALLSAFFARKAFCSWVCPVGTLSRAVEWLGGKTLWRKRKAETLVPARLDRALLSLKYLLLAFFGYIVLWQMDVAAIEAFMFGRYNIAVDAKMLLFFTDMSRTVALSLLALAGLSLLVKHFWCRYLCPYGAMLGLFSWLSPQKVVRDASTCIDCRACTRACPVEIRVQEKEGVTTPECTGCLSCVATCPVEDCLSVGRKGRSGWSPWLLPAVGIGTILLLWGVARLTGHWNAAIPMPDLMDAYRQAASLAHP
ncbi:MAG TPA: 4Fe-4S binding protein [Candidatus Deferrimicrobiaceae bacterium]